MSQRPSRRLSDALSPAAMAVAVLALVLAGAGVGWTAATIGTKDLKNNAVTSAKIKNGQVKAPDLVKEKKFKKVTLSNGTQGDCIWVDAGIEELPGAAPVGYRVDRFGTTHLSGIPVMVENGGQGDGMCGNAVDDAAEALDDLVAFRLPKAARPASTVYRVFETGNATPSILIIPGPGGFQLEPGFTVPHGAVMTFFGEGSVFFLDEVSFETKAAGVTPRTATPDKLGPLGRTLLEGAFGQS